MATDMAHEKDLLNDLIVVEKLAEWQRLKALVLDSVSSPITRRVYNMALDEFMGWFKQAPRPGFTKATVSAWRVSLEARGLAGSKPASTFGPQFGQRSCLVFRRFLRRQCISPSPAGALV